jgi:hypothetical protein
MSLAEFFWFFLLLTQFIEEQLAIVYVSLPNSIASHYDELVIGMPRHLPNVRVARDHLLFVVQTAAVFILEVAYA